MLFVGMYPKHGKESFAKVIRPRVKLFDSIAEAYSFIFVILLRRGGKYVSATYNTSVFEFAQPKLRNVLNHIQKEEQEHGLKIYQYMSANNMMG